jgi:plastocyanin
MRMLLIAALCLASAHVFAAEVSIDNFAFTPAEITIKAGESVTWTNRDDIPHTVTDAAHPPAFRSPALDTDDHVSFTFDKPGTYRYFCSLHPHMQATVMVR